jgi:MHS family proline/betaine transporter-like MFS transporter
MWSRNVVRTNIIYGKTMSQQNLLTREQKEAVGLLSIGTFLEYFDFMLYIHMAVLLNGLFFPQYDHDTNTLLTALTFFSTYLLRPVGALIFGWIGDNLGRRFTVIITTFMMAGSCVTMALLPTYDEIGITATWCVIACRIVQGMSSMGEIVGATVYLTEAVKPPQQCPVVTILSFLAALGGTAALGVASLTTLYDFNWRIAFWIGAIIAVIGFIARTTLRETIDFADAKRRMKRRFEDARRDVRVLENNPIWKEKVNKTTLLAYFLIQCGWPVCFYIAFIHCGDILMQSFHYSPEEVIHHNFFLGMVEMFGVLPLIYLSRFIYPVLILKVRFIIFTIFILFFPYLLNHVQTPLQLLCIQSFIMFFALEMIPAIALFIKHFPVLKRFTLTAVLYALSRALMFIVTGVICIYLTKYYGNYGLFIVLIPLLIGFAFGIYHFEKLEKEAGKCHEQDENCVFEIAEDSV